MVITSKNPVHSVLFLILCFFNTSILFILLKAEFLAMVLLIVYVGAVAVLFLFVVMMLDINISRFRESFSRYLPIGLFVGLVIFFELILIIRSSEFFSTITSNDNTTFLENTLEIGKVLYTDYFLLFQLSGIILLVAMIGAILLTLRKREGVKKQNIYQQIFKK